MKLIYT